MALLLLGVIYIYAACLIIFLDDIQELEEGEYKEDEVEVDEDEEEENGSVHDDGEGER